MPLVEPTPERYRHGKIVGAASIATEDSEAIPGARVHRVQTPIERYARRGSITERQALAADDLRSDWEFGIIGIRSGAQVGKGGGPAEMSAAQLDAATAYRHAVRALGHRLSEIVLPIVIGNAAGGEITAETLAARFAGYDRKQVMGALKIGLETLADHYASCGDFDRAVRYA